ncbi:MAG: hypothetical protein H0X38_09040 [Planctomycetes bacterium]|nr:hypothetical protein [Planctomycetota bacterium]
MSTLPLAQPIRAVATRRLLLPTALDIRRFPGVRLLTSPFVLAYRDEAMRAGADQLLLAAPGDVVLHLPSGRTVAWDAAIAVLRERAPLLAPLAVDLVEEALCGGTCCALALWLTASPIGHPGDDWHPQP